MAIHMHLEPGLVICAFFQQVGDNIGMSEFTGDVHAARIFVPQFVDVSLILNQILHYLKMA